MSAWEIDGGNPSNPDHWRREVSEAVTLCVWPRGDAWIWEVWNTTHVCGGPTPDEQRGCPACEDPDEPTIEDEAATFDDAMRAAEKAAGVAEALPRGVR